jgi:cobyric acid synthase
VYRERRKELPALPKTRAEVHETLSNISVLTNKEVNVLLVNDQDKGIVICTCYANIACLCNDITDLFIDGTLYKVLPSVIYCSW